MPRDLLWLSIANALNNAVTAVTGFWLAAELETAEFGRYSASANAIVLLASAIDFGVNTATVRSVGRERETSAKATILASGFALKLKCLNVVLLLLFPLALTSLVVLEFGERLVIEVLVVTAAAAVLNIWSFLRARLQARQNFHKYASLTICYALARMAAVALALAVGLEHAALYLVALYLLAPTLTMMPQFMSALKELPQQSDSARSELLRYGRPVLLSSTLYPLVFSVPLFALMSKGRASEAGAYGVALLFGALLQPLNDAIRAYFTPKASSLQSDEDAKRYIRSAGSRLPWLILSLAAMTMLAAGFYVAFLERKYPGILAVICVLVSASGLALIGGVFNSIVHYLGIPSIDSRVNVLRVLLVAFVSIHFISEFGLIAGAVSTFVAVLVGEVIVFSSIASKLQLFSRSNAGG